MLSWKRHDVKWNDDDDEENEQNSKLKINTLSAETPLYLTIIDYIQYTIFKKVISVVLGGTVQSKLSKKQNPAQYQLLSKS